MKQKYNTEMNAQRVTLESIRVRKEQLLEGIRKDKDSIGKKWENLITPHEANTKGEKIMNMVDNAFAIYDGAMFGLKMMRRFRGLFRR